MAGSQLTAERLREVFHYDPDTGVFTWQLATGRKVRVGTPAGCLCKTHGYILMSVDGTKLPGHQAAWLYVHGKWPEADIDHINGVRSDNRIANLRDVSRRVNSQNQRIARSNSSSGFLGIYLHKASGLWHASIKDGDGKKRSLGYYAKPEDGHEAYLAAKRRLHEGCTI